MGRTSRKLGALRARLPTLGAPEHDPAFRRTLEVAVQAGMRTAGLIGLIGATMYVLAHAIAGSDFVWWTVGVHVPRPVVLWNEVLIAGLGVVLLVAARIRPSLLAGRLLMSLFLLVAALALIGEDLQKGDFTFTAGWLTLVMFFAVGTVPFRPWQTGALCAAITLIYAFLQTSTQSLPEGLPTARLIFLGIVSLLCITMSAALYRSRVAQFLALIELRRTLRERFSNQMRTARPRDVSVMSAEERFIDDARRIVEDHIDDSSFDVKTFAEALNMSPRQLQRKLRALKGQRPTDFVRLMRLQRGAQLLEQHAGSVSEIAYSVGFSYPEYFSKCFRELYGRPPSAYAERKV